MYQLVFLLFPTVVVLAGVLALQPYRSMRRAVLSARRGSGTWDRARLSAELSRLGRHWLHSLVLPLAVLAAVQIALLVVLEALGAGLILADLFGDHHPEVALHAADVEALLAAAHEARLRHEGFASPGAALLQHWPLWPAYLALTTAGVALFLARRLPPQLRRYVRATRHAQQAASMRLPSAATRRALFRRQQKTR